MRSPLTGARLRREGHVLVAGQERWPVIDDIAYLRAGRADLVARALTLLDAEDVAGATAALLADRDDWAGGPGPDATALADLVAARDTVTLREAMRLLSYGPVADYLTHRWSDPTFLSGLALADAYWPPERPRVLEVACGPGQFLRAFGPHAASVTGIDVVWSKLWLARHFVAPAAALICFDAAYPWPLDDTAFDVVFCHDAFYFLPAKPHVAAEMARVAAAGAVTLVGHAHNADAANLGSGEPLTPAGYAALFAPAMLFDDTALTDAWIAGAVPRPGDVAAAAAVSLVHPGRLPGAVSARFEGAPTRLNPLYADADVAGRRVRVFPSERYAREYGDLATYPAEIPADTAADASLLRRRVFVDLPPRW